MNDSFDNKLIAVFASRPPLLDGFRSLGEGVGESTESKTAVFQDGVCAPQARF